MSDNKQKFNKQEFIVDDIDTVAKNDDAMNERINKLFGYSTVEETKVQKEYDPKELMATKKKLLLLFSGVVIAGIVIVVLLFRPFDLQFNKKNENENKPTENENKEEIKYPIQLDELNDVVMELNNRVSFELKDFYQVDLFPMYINEINDIKSVPNSIKLYFLKKDEAFKNVLDNNNISNFIETCDPKGIIISKEAFQNIANDIFSTDVNINYDSINYSYLMAGVEYKKLTLTLVENNYVVKCNDYQTNDIKRYVQKQFVKAVEYEDRIELYDKVVFISLDGKLGVYKDPSFTTLITGDKNAEFNSYIEKGSLYKYIFTKNDGKYHLSSIELVKEDD